MADSQTTEILRHFSSRATTSSTSEQLCLLRDLVPCVGKPDFPEQAVKGLIRLFTLSIQRYRDKASRRAVEDAIRSMGNIHPDTTTKQLLATLEDIGKDWQNPRPSPALCVVSLTGLRWSCLILHTTFSGTEKCTGALWTKLVKIQSALLHTTAVCRKASISLGAYKVLKSAWVKLPGLAAACGETLCSLEPSLVLMCLVGAVMRYFTETKDMDNINKFKSPLLDLYIKSVLSGKTSPPQHVLVNCESLLRHANHKDFKEKLLPAVQKAVLRNAEILMPAICSLLSSVSLDLSQYTQDISKILGSQLHSKDDTTCEETGRAFKILAQQCSDPGALEEAAKHLFNVLNGSEGKLTVVKHRMGVLTGLGNLSYNTVSGSGTQTLSSMVAELFIPYLQQEVHEGTLVYTLSMLSLWCDKFSTQVPTKLMEWFKKGVTLKTSTTAVRTAYLQCMLAAFSGDTLLQGLDMLPFLLQAAEKAASNLNQEAVVTEGLTAACLLTKMSAVDIESESRLSIFWNNLLDDSKQMLMSEKYLSQAPDDALVNVCCLCETLLLDHPQKLSHSNTRHLHRALVSLLTSPSWTVRKSAGQSTKKLLAELGSDTLAHPLLLQLRTILTTQSIVAYKRYLEDRDGEQGKKDGDTPRVISPKILAEALEIICLVPGLDSEKSMAEKLMLEALMDTHHSCIVYYRPSLWVTLCRQLKLDVLDLVRTHQDIIIDKVTQASPRDKAVLNVVKTLVFIAPKIILPAILNHVRSCLGDPALVQVTTEEYNIMRWPEGELYNQTILQDATLQDSSKGNIKRENKAYSYEDQLIEEELRKELEKKAAKGAKAKPQLTKKQEEALAAELGRESAIRTKLLQLDDVLVKASSLLQASIEGSPSALRAHINTVSKLLQPLLQSPLAAPRVMPVLVSLRTAVFDKDTEYLGTLIAYTTLRLSEPAAIVDPAWCQEELVHMAARAVQLLHLQTVPSENKSRLLIGPLSAPRFAYFFPLLKYVLQNGGSKMKGDLEVMGKAIEVIEEHTRLRGAEEDESGPALLPREEMLQLLCNVIGTSGLEMQNIAKTVVAATCLCANGDVGCTTCTMGEINILLEALQAPAAPVREAALEGLSTLVPVLPRMDTDADGTLKVVQRVWVARYDPQEKNQEIATKLWERADCEMDPLLCTLMLEDIVHHVDVIRTSAAAALSGALQLHPDITPAVMYQLLDQYQDKLELPPPVKDSFGRIISDEAVDKYEARCGIALALGQISKHLGKDKVAPLFSFFVPDGLNDRHVNVRKMMLEAAQMALEDHGKDCVSELLPVFEKFLAEAPKTREYDAVRQSVVILMGSLAKHLNKDDPKIKPIVAKLTETLSTPSQQVQEAVANCLPPLVPAIKSEAPDMAKKLLRLLLESENFAERKGAAYGLAGLIKGLGILSLKQLDVMTTLQDAIQNKKNFRHREGALFAFEMLCTMLGRLFEPYVVHLLPHLLLCFGDGNQYVREAADDTAKAVMSKLSAHGVKLVLPSLLAALEEDSWRTKSGSVELLGAMAYCAPKQLSSCLPTIVPKLIDVLTDSHTRVQNAGAQALKQIGSVIRNPEIQAIVPVLLEAISDPSHKTAMSLQVLLETKFVHFVDAPSLALIMPVVHRAFENRSTETRKMACQIIGNMYSLTDQKDLAPYLPSVTPGMKQALLDPVPEVRNVSARALGAMVKGMGEASFDDLLPWLMETLTSEQSSVDRSGAAQGLSEVMAGLGTAKLEELMPDFCKMADNEEVAPHIRDGYIMMFIYLPTTFREDFTPYVGPIIPPILKALADECEYLRDTALRAGQRIVQMYAERAIALLLPELEGGLFDDNWRIRYSSVQLLGDLLYHLSGVSGKMTTETASEDDSFGTARSQEAILRTLGVERRNRVLAGLYMGRSDVSLMVRQASLHIWKIIVQNTPRTLKDILDTLFELLLGCLASTSYDKRQVAARTLGDLVRKLGERVLQDVVPILERGLQSDKSDQRQGVCIGLSEIIKSTSKDMVIVFVDSLVPTIRKGLCDPLPEVREAASKTFDSLHSTVGARTLDDILPFLLKQLDDPDTSEFALDGLKQVMAVKSRVVLPYLVPQLTSSPVNTKALAFLSSVAGESLTKHLSRILPALLSALSQKRGTDEEKEELEHCQTLVLSVDYDLGVGVVIEELLSATKSREPCMRLAAVTILNFYCSQIKADYTEYVPQLLRGLIELFNDEDQDVLVQSWEALNAVVKRLDAAALQQHLPTVRQAVRYSVQDCKEQELPGFCLPKKGITPILPVFREGILNGSPELKEQAALGLGEIIKRTSAEALKPSVVNITGPLIRILGDRFSWNVKAAVLDTLGLLLGKVGMMLKPFLPQLQTTFLKALNDNNRAVRLKAAHALEKLVVIHTRVDPLFTELHTQVKNADDNSIRETSLQALRGVVTGAGRKAGDAIRKQLTATLLGMLGFPEDGSRLATAGCVGALCAVVPDTELNTIMLEHILDHDPSADWMLRQGRSVALAVALKEAASRLMDGQFGDKVTGIVIASCAADRIPICSSGVRALGFLLTHVVSNTADIPKPLLTTAVKALNHSSNDIKMVAAQGVNHVVNKSSNPLPLSVCRVLVPALVSNTKEKNTAVQASSELALVSLLQLRKGEDGLQACLKTLDPGAAESLNECHKRALKKVASQPEPKEEDLDDTIIMA
ncbi:stalled ribosome sensor GCN1-like [Branchiostoma floridae x Branchiostoma japonicum]